MSLLYGNQLNVAVLTDFAKGQKKKIDDLRKSRLLGEARIMTLNSYTGTEEADMEDMIGRDGFIALAMEAYGLEGLKTGEQPSQRVVKDVEDAFRLLSADVAEFDHFRPSSFLIEHPEVLKTLPGYEDALNRFEQLFKDINALLKQ